MDLTIEQLRTNIRALEARILALPLGSGRRNALQYGLDWLCAELGRRGEN